MTNYIKDQHIKQARPVDSEGGVKSCACSWERTYYRKGLYEAVMARMPRKGKCRECVHIDDEGGWWSCSQGPRKVCTTPDDTCAAWRDKAVRRRPKAAQLEPVPMMDSDIMVEARKKAQRMRERIAFNAAAKKGAWLECPVCGEMFEKENQMQRYCSDGCMRKACRIRKKYTRMGVWE